MIDMIEKVGITLNQILVELTDPKEDLQFQREEIQNIQLKMENETTVSDVDEKLKRLKENSTRTNDRSENYLKRTDKSYNLAMASIAIATISSVVSVILS